jgi:hypothetical protein
MAQQLWEQEIDKTVDWGGDSSTGGAAVSGQFVQKFIKDTLAKKFGYLHYDRTALKYYVFADEDDYNKYANDTTGEHAGLLLATFDAPAPASITVDDTSRQQVTILASETGQEIRFRYIVKDSGSNPITEAVQARIVFNNGGTITQVIQNFEIDFDNYQSGVTKTINIDNYLTIGTNNISITLTGISTQATTTINFIYTVVDLQLSSSFDNKKGIEFDSLLGTMDNYFNVPYSISGQGEKYMEWYVNGQPLNQNWVPAEFNALTTTSDAGYLASKNPEYSSNMAIYLTNDMGELQAPFKLGKNTIQFRMYVENKDGSRLYSRTKYYDFVLIDKNVPQTVTYILYSQDLGSGALFQPEDVISFSTQQYSSTSFNYGLFSTSGAATTLEFGLTKTDGDVTETVASMMRSISSGEEQLFEYTFLTYGAIDINIKTLATDSAGNPLDTLHILVNVAKSSAQIAVTKESLVLNLEAQNRSNSEPNPATWNYRNIDVQFNNVLWNETSGWDGKALVLNSGATAFIPFNVFDNYTASGLTVEVDFETFNVQDEKAVIFSVRNADSRSHVEISACGCSVGDTSPAGSVTGNFKDNERLKLAFIFGEYKENYDLTKDLFANKTFIVMNGILDRATVFGGSLKWNNPVNPGIVLGDVNGKAGVKIRSIRVYNKALSLDDELTNFIAESDNLLEVYNRNNIYVEGTNNISLDICKNIIPTLVMYGDTNILDGADNKSNNAEFDAEFYDPTDPNVDFFARGAWFSCQGTSSMFYPKKNFRMYFGKTNDGKTKDTTAKYWTEFYRAGEFTHGETNDYTKLGQFQCNKKTCADGYHKLYNNQEAEVLESRGNQLYYQSADGNFYPCSYGDGSTSTYYVTLQQPIRDWKTVKEFRYSGATLYSIDGYSKIQNPITGVEYDVPTFKKLKGKNALKEDKTYYVDQACWKQYEGSGWTNRWTLKTDFAESSMTHNSGVGRLWGNAMKNVKAVGDDGKTGYICRTTAQQVMGQIDGGVDIRTSCDGKPIVIFRCPLVRDAEGNVEYDENGFRKYGNAEFVGQFNIMTDKGSTPLFGFEDIYDENGTKIFDASNVECWEASNNGSLFGQGVNLITDIHAKEGEVENTFMGTRFVFSDYEPRWPDVEIESHHNGKEYLVSHTHHIESLWRFVHFCKPAVDYLVDGLDGYTLSPYVELKEDEYQNAINQKLLLFTLDQEKYEAVGNKEYNELVYDDINDLYANAPVYYQLTNIDYENVEKRLSGKTIENHIYKAKVASFDATYGTYVEDVPFDDARVDEENVNYGDKIAGSAFEEDYYVNVYLEAIGGGKYQYVDNYGQNKQFVGSVDRDAYEVDKDGQSFAGKTYMQYFTEKKYEYFDVWKMAAYYIYLMRFGAVDQVVKNSMLTTEDGQHYYYINYDNDTTLGVRNDGHIVFHWTLDRHTYDYSKGQFAYAGPTSVLWNLLENDTDFMNKVKQLDTAMFNSNVLSAEIALDMFNNKQAAVWPERMYNMQEQIKYLPSGDGYLNFIHGSRTQHRTWWVTNRFNLYDSKWFSGEYSQNTIKFYMGISNSNANVFTNIMSITAARQNVFGLTNSDLDGAVPDNWAKELPIDESFLWTTNSSWNGISSPFSIMGVDKIKVLDFRKAVEAGHSFGKMEFIGNIANNWIKSKGTMMTKLLYGISDEFRTSDVYRYTNISEVDQVLTIGGVDVTIAPGASYDANSALTVDKSVLTLNILGPTRCNVALLSNLNDVTTLEEIDIRNCYNEAEEYHFGDLKIGNLTSLHVYRAIGSSITTFKPAEGVILNEVSLPVNRITDIELRNVTFTPAVDQTAPTFMYTPDRALKNVVLRGVSGLDVVKFVNDWLTVITEANIDPKSCNLTLENVNCIDVPVEFVMETVERFNLLNFTGFLSLISSVDERQLTKEQYDAIVEKYGQNVFSTGSALRFSADEGMFWSSTMTYRDDLLNKPSNILPTFASWYEGIHETEYTFKCSNFPVNENDTLWYSLYYINNQGKVTKINETDKNHNIVYATTAANLPCVDLTYDANTSSFKFKSYFNGVSARNRQQSFIVYAVINGKENVDSGIFISCEPVEVVNNFTLTCDNQHIGVIDSTMTITDNVKHTITAGLYDGAKLNVPVSKFTVTLDPSDSKSLSVKVTKNDDLTKCTFELTPAFIATEITVNAIIEVRFATEYDNGNGVGCPITMTLPVKMMPVFANEFDLIDVNENVVESKSIALNEANKTFTYTIRPYNTDYLRDYGEYYYNIPLESVTIEGNDFQITNQTNVEISDDNMMLLNVIVRSNKELATGKYISYYEQDDFTIVLSHQGDEIDDASLPKHNCKGNCSVLSQIVYPEVIELISNGKNIETTTPTKLKSAGAGSSTIVYNVSLRPQNLTEDVTYPCEFNCVPTFYTDYEYTEEGKTHEGFEVVVNRGETWRDTTVSITIPENTDVVDMTQYIKLNCTVNYTVGTDNVTTTKEILTKAISSLAAYDSPKQCEPGVYYVDVNGLIYLSDAESFGNMADQEKLVGVLYVSSSINKSEMGINVIVDGNKTYYGTQSDNQTQGKNIFDSGLIIKPNYVAIPLHRVRTNNYSFAPNFNYNDNFKNVNLLHDLYSDLKSQNAAPNYLTNSRKFTHKTTNGIINYLSEISESATKAPGSDNWANYETTSDAILKAKWISGKFFCNALCGTWIDDFWLRNDNPYNLDKSQYSFKNTELLSKIGVEPVEIDGIENGWLGGADGEVTTIMAIPYFHHLFERSGIDSKLSCFVGSKEEYYLLLIEGLDAIKSAVNQYFNVDAGEASDPNSINISLDEILNLKATDYILSSTIINARENSGISAGAQCSILPLRVNAATESTDATLSVSIAEENQFSFNGSNHYMARFNAIPFIEI